jgi:short-subunit dehydrogenase
MVRPRPQSILITGASSGVGASLAVAYAREGVRLALIGRHVERLQAVAQSCRARGAEVDLAFIDVRDARSMRVFIEAFDDAYPLDLLIANAGVSAGTLGGDESEDQARTIFDVNVTGVLNTIHPLMPRMKKRMRGQIALMSSLASYRAFPTAPAYCASKAAVRFYAEALRGLLAPYGVHVSAICPGYIDTPMTRVNGFYMPAMMSSDMAAKRIICGLHRQIDHISFPRRLAWPLWILSFLPSRITNFIFDKLPSKPHFN